VAQSTVEHPPGPPPASPSRPVSPGGGGSRDLRRAYPWLIGAAALLVFSALLAIWANTRPGFDPYGWLVWGHQTLLGNLDTNAAPSWKPLPYLFTLPYALAGHYQMWLWLITAVAVALAGSVFGARIAYRLTGGFGAREDGDTRRWYAALAAGAFAGLALLGLQDYWHYILSAQSDPMIVSLCLGAIDCHLSRRYRWAFVFAVVAALGRPEVWVFLGLYSIWAWRAIRSMRWLIVAGILVVAALWFGIPALTSRTPFVAASNALGSGRALHGDKIIGTAQRFLSLYAAPLEIAAALSVALAAWRRDWVTIVLAIGVVGWVVLEIAFALHGWPGLARYMFEPAGVMIVIAAVLVGRLLLDPLDVPIPAWLGVAVVVVLVASLLPTAISHARDEHKDIAAQRVRTKEIDQLTGVINRLGGPSRFHACGEPLTRLEYQTILAWNLRVNVATVGYKYGPAMNSGRPIVLFTPQPQGGWVVQALHQRLPQCRTLPS
jgi:hypothetical protein